MRRIDDRKNDTSHIFHQTAILTETYNRNVFLKYYFYTEVTYVIGKSWYTCVHSLIKFFLNGLILYRFIRKPILYNNSLVSFLQSLIQF